MPVRLLNIAIFSAFLAAGFVLPENGFAQNTGSGKAYYDDYYAQFEDLDVYSYETYGYKAQPDSVQEEVYQPVPSRPVPVSPAPIPAQRQIVIPQQAPAPTPAPKPAPQPQKPQQAQKNDYDYYYGGEEGGDNDSTYYPTYYDY